MKFLQYVPNSPVAGEGELDSDLIPIEFDFQSYFKAPKHIATKKKRQHEHKDKYHASKSWGADATLVHEAG